jgi:hypothetical protein
VNHIDVFFTLMQAAKLFKECETYSRYYLWFCGTSLSRENTILIVERKLHVGTHHQLAPISEVSYNFLFDMRLKFIDFKLFKHSQYIKTSHKKI